MIMQVTLIDSPVANVANIARALRAAGGDLHVTRDAREIARAAKLVLPGVGSFAAAMRWLTAHQLDLAIGDAVCAGASLLGICVGHQLLFDTSHEMGVTGGLSMVGGEVLRLDTPLPVPQIGWNRVHGRGPLFDGVEDEVFYFVNSYAAPSTPHEIAWADYGGRFTAAVQSARVFGVQFHPEKSSAAGLRVLRNFIQWT
jgi:glutamine amidotransferase